jgi:hypothetical protein
MPGIRTGQAGCKVIAGRGLLQHRAAEPAAKRIEPKPFEPGLAQKV